MQLKKMQLEGHTKQKTNYEVICNILFISYYVNYSLLLAH